MYFYDTTLCYNESEIMLTRIGLITLVILSLALGVQWYRADKRADAAETALHTQQSMSQYATSNMQPATFVRADDVTFTYSVPVPVTVDGQVFMNREERTAKYSPLFTVFGAISGTGPQAIQNLQPSTPIHVLINGGGTRAIIQAVYVD